MFVAPAAVAHLSAPDPAALPVESLFSLLDKPIRLLRPAAAFQVEGRNPCLGSRLRASPCLCHPSLHRDKGRSGAGQPHRWRFQRQCSPNSRSCFKTAAFDRRSFSSDIKAQKREASAPEATFPGGFAIASSVVSRKYAALVSGGRSFSSEIQPAEESGVSTPEAAAKLSQLFPGRNTSVVSQKYAHKVSRFFEGSNRL
jgi:hypothetical protein